MAALSVPKITTFAGTPVYFEAQTSTMPGLQQTLISFTVPSLTIRTVYQVVIACRVEGKFVIRSNGNAIGSGRTGPAQSNIPFMYAPPRPFIAGSVFDVLFTARPNSPEVDVEVYIQATDTQD